VVGGSDLRNVTPAPTGSRRVPIASPPFEAVLLLSFGGPEGPDDVMPFLENVTRGRGIPRARLEAVAEHYMLFGGRSPINDECRRLVAALESEFARRGPPLPVYWGNRNWKPLLADTVARMARDGVRRAVAIATSAFSSYSACRQYLEDIDHARDAVGTGAPVIEKLAPYWNDGGFIETMIAHTRVALAAIRAAPHAGGGASGPGTEGGDANLRLVFTAHSIPMAMAQSCDYVAELEEASSIVASAVAPQLGWDLVYQSRSGSPSQPWLGPDIGDHLHALHAQGTRRVVVVPIGFVADHMEVVFDLDTEARAVADSLGMTMARAACAGAAPRFVAGLRDLVVAHIEGRPAVTLGTRGPRPWPCPPGCCAYTPPGRLPT
jgi:ferrochelatase